MKIHGHRIELGEIESHLLKNPQIKEAVVSAVGENRHDKQLIAYIVPKEDSCINVCTHPLDQAAFNMNEMQGELTDPIERLQFKLKKSGIRQFENTSDNKRIVAYVVMEKQENTEKNHSLLLKKYLKQNLPDYMLPETFLFIDALPLSPNGKIDRNALPESVIRKTSYLYPRDMIELKLSKLWEHLLQMSPISITDDFFENGGNSLRAIRLISNINQKFNHQGKYPVIFISLKNCHGRT
ncbi:MAG: hypothetical protein OMM_02916 [Candidatus Magnetoglobus multicellularis str. Araruama]|uniref:Carrier domain-containing protein n=1 Tax=Candidatus Magnetoglobus multicellularis str. Araruama TaxID=890399 RepID=A0A1V1P7X2_9BACT|nr:MAG: hypothetical protein OMM_02916 [Candidatus Magnetoglobus multicellularis str. Araruama]